MVSPNWPVECRPQGAAEDQPEGKRAAQMLHFGQKPALGKPVAGRRVI